MRFPSLFAVRRRASSRPRPARRPASCRLAVEALEDHTAPCSLAPGILASDLEAPALSDVNHASALDLVTPNDPAGTARVHPGNGEGTLRPAREVSTGSAPEAPHSGLPGSDFKRDPRLDVVSPGFGTSSAGDVAALLRVLGASHSAPAPIAGGISPDVDGEPTFIPIRQDGCVITFEHPDDHDLTGSVQGRWAEVGILTLDVCTGQGVFRAEGVFSGTVQVGDQRSQPGTATLRVQGEVRDFFFIDRGHFVITHGQGGLAGLHATGTFAATVGVGGTYEGLAHFDGRR